MSGGAIVPQDPGEHQVVIFTFYGKIDDNSAKKWNKAILDFKQQILKDKITGVTMKGEKTPPEWGQSKGRRKKK